MLMQRVITALILIPPVIAGVWYLQTPVIACLFAAILLVGAWEWTRLMALQSFWLRVAYLTTAAALFAALYGLRENSDVLHATLWAALLWWLAALYWVIRYPTVLDAGNSRSVMKAAIGLLLLGPAFLALVLLHAREHGPLWILFVLVLIWAADTGAYFSGRGFGRHKLAIRVSPGKTWEGAVGGLVLSTTVAALAGHWVFNLAGQLPWFILLCSGVVAFSIVGDLTESMFKRQASVKDSGSILPGHGGVLDRLDSLFAAAPLLLGGLLTLGI